MSSNGVGAAANQQPSSAAALPGGPTMIRELLPKKGYLHNEDHLSYVVCKPKLLPLKSYTVEKLERIQRESVAKIKESMDSASLE